MLKSICNNGQLLIFVASFIFSLSTVCVKVTTLPSFETAFIPSAGCLILFSLYSLVNKIQRRFAPLSKEGLGAPLITPLIRGTAAAYAGGGAVVLALTIFRGLLGACNLNLFYLSLEDLDIDTAVTIFFCSPVIAVVMEWALNIFLRYTQQPRATIKSPREVSESRFAQLDQGLGAEPTPTSDVIVASESPLDAIQTVEEPKTIASTGGDGMVSKIVIDSSYESDEDYRGEAEEIQPIDTSISLRVILGCALTIAGVILVSQPPMIFGLQHNREDFSPAVIFNSTNATWGSGGLLSLGASTSFRSASSSSTNSLNPRFLISSSQTETLTEKETQVQALAQTEAQTLTQPATKVGGVEDDAEAAGVEEDRKPAGGDEDTYRWLLLAKHVASHPTTVASAAATGIAMLLALGAATCNAASFITVGMLKGRQSTFNLTWWYHLIMCLCTAGPMLAGYPRPFVMPNQRDCMYMLAITCAQCLGQLLLNRGFSLISASRGASINVMQVLFSYLWELTLLGGKLDLIGAIGAASVMLGVIVVASDKPQVRP